MATRQKKITTDLYMTTYEISIQFGITMARLKDWQQRRKKGDKDLPRFLKLSTNRVLYKYEDFKEDMEKMIFEI
jgi:hypothetical protein